MAKTDNKAPKAALPSFLNVNRSISPSEGLLFGIAGERQIPVEVSRRGIRGAISSYGNVYKGDKVDSQENIAKQLDPKNANLQQIDVAFLPVEAERLNLRFSVVFQSNSLAPSACNDDDFRKALVKFASAYKTAGGYEELAARYAWNLINGRTLWRNRFATEKVAVVAYGDGTKQVFNVDNIRLDAFEREAMPIGFTDLASKIADALSGETEALFVTVDMSGRMPQGAEVYPSQEFIPDAKKAKEDGKVLSSTVVSFEGRTGVKQATMHAQKIGNALRVIDDWHGQVDDYGVVAVEAYGYVQSRTNAIRLPSSPATDVYGALRNLAALTEALETTEVSGDAHYLMAMLVRGGVFSGDKKA
jgi:CRISPR-associated protein Csy3